MAKEKKATVTKDIGKRVLERLKAKDRATRTKRTLVLTEDAYNEFEKLCRAENRYPSDVIDEFIAIFNEECRGNKK